MKKRLPHYFSRTFPAVLMLLGLFSSCNNPTGSADSWLMEDSNGKLLLAAEYGLTATVKRLLSLGAEPNTRRTFGGHTALILASISGHIAVVQDLILAKANLNIQNNVEFTALIYAAKYGYTEIALALIAANASPDIQNESKDTALIWAAARGHMEIVRALINAGADLNIKDDSGTTALVYATRNKHTEIVTLLRVAGAS